MPIPKPKKDEKEEQYISRCIATLTKNKDFDSAKQRAAVCYSQWRGKDKKKKESIIVKIKEDIKIGNIILEKGDKIKILN